MPQDDPSAEYLSSPGDAFGCRDSRVRSGSTGCTGRLYSIAAVTDVTSARLDAVGPDAHRRYHAITVALFITGNLVTPSVSGSVRTSTRQGRTTDTNGSGTESRGRGTIEAETTRISLLTRSPPLYHAVVWTRPLGRPTIPIAHDERQLAVRVHRLQRLRTKSPVASAPLTRWNLAPSNRPRVPYS